MLPQAVRMSDLPQTARCSSQTFVSDSPNKFAHPTALVESNRIGEGTRIWAFVHVLDGSSIGDNCNIGDYVFIENGSCIGNNVTLKNHVCVWEGITIEDDAFVGPFVAFTNDLHPRSPRMNAVRSRYERKEDWLVKTTVGKGCSIGANATIVGGIQIGAYSMIGAGATVTRDVEPFALVVGSPAKQIGYVCRCGRRREDSVLASDCPFCGMTPEDVKKEKI